MTIGGGGSGPAAVGSPYGREAPAGRRRGGGGGGGGGARVHRPSRAQGPARIAPGDGGRPPCRRREPEPAGCPDQCSRSCRSRAVSTLLCARFCALDPAAAKKEHRRRRRRRSSSMRWRTHTRAHTHKQTQTQTHKQTHKHTPTNTQTHTQTHTHTHKHTHIHTHTPVVQRAVLELLVSPTILVRRQPRCSTPQSPPACCYPERRRRWCCDQCGRWRRKGVPGMDRWRRRAIIERLGGQGVCCPRFGDAPRSDSSSSAQSAASSARVDSGSGGGGGGASAVFGPSYGLGTKDDPQSTDESAETQNGEPRDRGIWLRSCGAAHRSSRRIASRNPRSVARPSGVTPLLDGASRRPPAASSRRMAAVWPRSAARCSGVSPPKPEAAFGSAPFCSSSCARRAGGHASVAVAGNGRRLVGEQRQRDGSGKERGGGAAVARRRRRRRRPDPAPAPPGTACARQPGAARSSSTRPGRSRRPRARAPRRPPPGRRAPPPPAAAARSPPAPSCAGAAAAGARPVSGRSASAGGTLKRGVPGRVGHRGGRRERRHHHVHKGEVVLVKFRERWDGIV